MIGSRKTYYPLPAGIKTRQAHGGHDGFGATHMKGHLVHLRYGFEPGNIVSHQRVERTEHWTEIFDALQPLVHPLLVVLKSRHIDAVRATHIQAPMAIEVV